LHRVFVHLGARPDWGVGAVRSVRGSLVKVRFAQRGAVTVDLCHHRLSIVRLNPLRRS
jgi:hypothetical protein